MAFYPSFAPGLIPPTSPPVDTGPISIPIFGGPIVFTPTDPIGGGGSGFGFGPPQLPVPVTPMPSPIQMPTGQHCLLRRRRRINWCNPRALARANRRLHSFNKHARKFIKITRKVKTPKRRR